jgi:hypothetical protein
VLVGSLFALGGTTAYTLATAATPHTGSIPTSGPSGSAMAGFGGAAGGVRDGAGAIRGRGQAADGSAAAPSDGSGAAPGGTTGTGVTGTGGSGTAPVGAFGGGGAVTNTELIALLNATDTRWAAATTGAQSAAGYVLATDKAIMAVGGFTGSDPSPTLAQFQQYVADGDISYFIAGGAGGGGGAGGPGGGGASSEIQAWVEANFTATTIGGATVYELTSTTGA